MLYIEFWKEGDTKPRISLKKHSFCEDLEEAAGLSYSQEQKSRHWSGDSDPSSNFSFIYHKEIKKKKIKTIRAEGEG